MKEFRFECDPKLINSIHLRPIADLMAELKKFTCDIKIHLHNVCDKKSMYQFIGLFQKNELIFQFEGEDESEACEHLYNYMTNNFTVEKHKSNIDTGPEYWKEVNKNYVY